MNFDKVSKHSFIPIIRQWLRPLHIGACLVLLSLCSLFLTDLLGFRDDGRDSVSDSRKILAESTAMHLSSLASIDDIGAIQFAISALVSRSNEIQAAALVSTNGEVLAENGNIDTLTDFAPLSTLSHISVPIFNKKERWGELRLVFTPMRSVVRELQGLLFFVLCSLIAFTFLLNKAFIQLDPNRAVPDRVDTAFNLFSSGVVILDNQLRIVMANQAACDMGSTSKESLLGSSLESWNWQSEEDWQEPWKTTFQTGLIVSDQPLTLLEADGSTRLVMISCAVVGDDKEGVKGVIVTLDDVSSIERKNSELAATLKELRATQEDISKKNKELERLATTDTLTGISNRWVLMERLTLEYERAREVQEPLACIMTDIDNL